MAPPRLRWATRNPESLRAALDGVFYIAPVFAPEEVWMGLNMVEAARVSGVRRIVFSSVIHPTLSALSSHAAKAPGEEAIIASDLDYTILHPSLLFQNSAAAWPHLAETGVFAEPYSIEKRVARVDNRDVAEVVAITLTEDRLLCGTFERAAEGNFDRHAVATRMGEALGRPVRAETVPFNDWADQAEIPYGGPVRRGLKTMYDWYDAHGFMSNVLTLRAILGREARTLRTFFTELAFQEQGPT